MQLKIKVGTILQLAEILAEYDIEKIDIHKTEFPLVLVIEEKAGKHVLLTYVSKSDFEEPEFITEISRILEWHDKYVKEGINANGLHVLMQSRSRLSILIEYLGQYVADLNAQSKETEFKRRIVRDRAILLYRGQGDTTVDSQAKARIECEPWDKKEVEAKKHAQEAIALLKAVEQTLNAMSGEIRSLEGDLKRANYSQVV